jgi:LuxR family transcriptional regulator, quorum-sensing system regulator CciR
MTQLADVEAFIKRSQTLGDPHALDILIDEITHEMGFDFYALIHHVDLTPMNASLSHMRDGSLVALTNYPPEWVEAYVQRNIVADDPVLIASQRSAVGFRWSDTDKIIPFTSNHKAVTHDTRRAGLSDGFTVPAHIPGEANGSCNFAIRAGRSLPEQNLHMAQLIGSFAFQAARTMIHNARAKALPYRPQLTGRQLECLALVAKGKSDWEIGRILGIGEETVKHHVKLAREAYDVPTRVQATFRALFDGHLSLGDVIG